MVDIALDVLAIYAFAFASGFGLYQLLVPEFLKARFLYPFLIPGLGLAQFAIINAYLVAASADLRLSFVLCGFLGIVAAAVALRTSPLRQRALTEVTSLAGVGRYRIAAFAVVMALLLSPLLSTNAATTPYRIGIDQIGYAETAQYLFEGGSVAEIATKLKEAVGTRDLHLAELHNDMSLNFGTYIDSEFLLKAMRWGFPAVLATLTMLTGNSHVYSIEFLLPVLSYALLICVAYFVLLRVFELHPAIAFTGALVGLGLNCNLLNVYYEGQFAQVFVSPYILLLLTVYLHVRHLPGNRPITAPEILKAAGFCGLLLGSIFAAYNEALVLIAALIAVILVLDVILYRSTSRLAFTFLGLAAAVGFVVGLPVSARFVAYSIANLGGLSRAGFWQPHWGSLAEILGLLNMYVQTGYALVDRDLPDAALSLILSLLAAAVILRFFIKDRRVDVSFWLAPFAVVALVYVKTRYVDVILNYPYMKTYTLLAPLMVCVAFAAVARTISSRAQAARYAVVTLVLGCVALSGNIYIKQYLAQSQIVSRDLLQMYRFDKGRFLEKFALLTPSSDITDQMFAPLIAMNWLRTGLVPQVLSNELSRPVAVLLPKQHLFCHSCFTSRFPDQILYDSPSVVVFDTRMTVASLCSPGAQRFTIDLPPARWNDLPLDQCDYTYPQRLPFVH